MSNGASGDDLRAATLATSATPSERADREFVEYFASLLPSNSGLGQSNCAGQSGATVPSDIHFFSDTCNHQHVQMDY